MRSTDGWIFCRIDAIGTIDAIENEASDFNSQT